MKEISVKSDKNDFNHVANKTTTTKAERQKSSEPNRGWGRIGENLYHSCFVWFFICDKIHEMKSVYS